MKTALKVYAVLIAYNPDIVALRKNLTALQEQATFIVIVNNSIVPLPFEDCRLKVIELGRNLGIARAQNIGMKWAFDNGADFILQMDQDSCPENGMVANLLSCYLELTSQGMRVGLVGPFDFDKFTQELHKPRLNRDIIIPNTDYCIADATLSSGSLIPRSVYEKLGGLEDRLFIDAVDFEYCWRMRKEGFLIVRNKKALLGHRLGEGKKKLWGPLEVKITAPFRHYYQFRNVLLLLGRSYAPWYWRVSNVFKLVTKIAIFPFLFDDGRLRLSYMLKGIADALKGKYGKLGES